MSGSRLSRPRRPRAREDAPASGPAHSAERSTTRGAVRTAADEPGVAHARRPIASSVHSVAEPLRPNRGVRSSAGRRSCSAAMANPIERPRATRACASARPMHAAIAASSLASNRSFSKSAGSISRSADRARFSAIVSPSASNRRHPPPAEVRPGIRKPARIARSPSRVAPSSAAQRRRPARGGEPGQCLMSNRGERNEIAGIHGVMRVYNAPRFAKDRGKK